MLCCDAAPIGRSCPIADVVSDNTMTIVAASAGAHFTDSLFSVSIYDFQYARDNR